MLLAKFKEHKVLLKLEAAGLDDKLAQKVIDSKSNNLTTKIVRLIENVYVRTSSVDSAGYRAGVGFFDQCDLHVYYWQGWLPRRPSRWVLGPEVLSLDSSKLAFL